MNRSRIEGVDETWNPLTGCHHGCPYCWARRFAKRMAGRFGYPTSDPFQMVLHKDRLCEPAKRRKPSTIAVCWMGDLFGEWVPDHIIGDVVQATMAAARHRYLFLTKNPNRYGTIDLFGGVLESWWLGTSITYPHEAGRLQILWDLCPPGVHRWASLEPLHGLSEANGCRDLPWDDLRLMDWVVIGTQTGTDAHRAPAPHRTTLRRLVRFIQEAGIPVLVKNNAREHYHWPDAPQETPW